GAETVREPGGLVQLWRAELHPDLVVRWWEAARVPEPLPMFFYLGAAYTDVDLAWLADTLSHAPDPDVAVWLAWTEGLHDPDDPQACGRWLDEGLTRRTVEVLVRAGVAHGSAERIAESSWLPVRTVATRLAHWATAGCTPDADDFALLERFGLADYRPSALALDALCRELVGVPNRPSRTHVGVMLALAGSRERVRGFIELGARAPHDVATMLDEPLRRPALREKGVG
ncbi:MAG TPA: hypothetical protein PLP61_16370, partial [Nocardioides sp.]|uniref:hypothetical protein n=1 Tax=Nocardioides sp. TaxID=35761 RepID=UPI002C5A6F83